MREKNNPPIFDGHNDTLLNLYKPDRGEGRSFFQRSDIGHVDLPRAREGGLGGGFFAIFAPTPKMAERMAEAKKAAGKMPDNFTPKPVEKEIAQEITSELTALLYQLEKNAGGQLKVVRSAGELAKCLEDGVLAAILHFEGAEAIEPDLSNLAAYYEKGLRSIGITWSRPNAFGFGVPFKFPHSPDTGPGLTDAGIELVRECNRLGILVDLAHLNEKGFWDVARISDAPLVTTHSGVFALCQSTRNLTDKQLKAIGDSGGIVGINFHVGFLREDGQDVSDTPLTEIVRHVNYVVDKIGIDHVALGSDFDGAKMPADLGDAAGLPKLMDALRTAGFDSVDLRKIANENWQRVLAQTWKE